MTNKEELKALLLAAWNDERVKGESFGVFLDRAAEAIIKAGWAKHSPQREVGNYQSDGMEGE